MVWSGGWTLQNVVKSGVATHPPIPLTAYSPLPQGLESSDSSESGDYWKPVQSGHSGQTW